jgi:1,4-alpha-glucan branching enzyme
MKDINTYENGMEVFTRSYEHYGIHVAADGGIVCREWAPGATALYLTGDFNNWNRTQYPFKQGSFGKWDLTIGPNADGSVPIAHGSIVKVGLAAHKILT